MSHDAEDAKYGDSRPPALSTALLRPDGSVECVHADELADAYGRKSMRVERLSRIEFDHAWGAWTVQSMQGEILYASARRRECVAWEHEHAEELIEQAVHNCAPNEEGAENGSNEQPAG